MTTPKLFLHVKHVHMVGIAGAGMCGIAEVLLNLGFVVSGSDMQLNEVTARLAAMGARIFSGHDAQNVQGADVLVYSSAVRPENVEVRAARDMRIPTIPRSEMLAELMRLKFGVAISGTHGKTTTTSIVGAILQRAELNPTLIVGGKVRALDSHVKMGSGDILVVEADEFDRSFLKLTPSLSVITTIEPEHLDTYNDLEGVKDAFVEFANKVPFYGSVVVCGDDVNINAILPRIKRPVISYGFGEDCAFRAFDVQHNRTSVTFGLVYAGKTHRCELQIPGRHNVLNALAAIAIADQLEIPFEVTARALAEFTGVHRRFEVKGEVDGVLIVDDYAHHPTEVESTLRTARLGWPDRRIVALFQPHLFSRTRDFAADFGTALSLADVLLLTDIYPSRERPIPGVTSDLIADAVRQTGTARIHLLGSESLVEQTRTYLQRGDVLIVMGAGTITQVADQIAGQKS